MSDPLSRCQAPLPAEQQLRFLLQSVRDYAFITYDLENRITSWSAGAEAILGWTESEVLGKTGDLLFTPEDRAKGKVEREVETARREGRAEDERWHLKKGGIRLWGSGVMTVLRDEAGQPIGFAKVFRDLTQRRNAGMSVREREAQARALIANLPGGAAFVVDHDLCYLLAGGEALQTAGMTAEEFVGRRVEEVLPPALVAEYTASFRRVLEGEPFAREHEAHGHVYLTRGVPLYNDHGEVYAALAVSYDITERRRAEAALRESEARFRLLVENVQEYALFQTDLAGKVTSWNPGAERLFGYTSTEMLGQSVAQLLTPEDQAVGVLGQEIALVRAGERKQDARWMVRKDGTRFWAQWLTEPANDEAGHLRGLAKVLRDETDRLRSEQSLRASLAEKEALLREIHHRVKNNLQVIVSLLSLQADQITDPATLEIFQDTQSRVRSIARIHETLYSSRDLAEVEFGQYTHILLRDLFAFYDTPTEKIEWQLDVKDMALNITQAIPLGLILNELVVNCLKHAFPQDRRGTVRVSLRYVDEELAPGETVDDAPGQLCVEDDGVGLPPGFDLEQAESMGLYLVRILTRQLQGTLTWASGSGTRICIQFPLALEEAQVDL